MNVNYKYVIYVNALKKISFNLFPELNTLILFISGSETILN